MHPKDFVRFSHNQGTRSMGWVFKMNLDGKLVKLLHARSIRLPKDMSEAIQRCAESNQRTFNTEVLWRLHQSFKKPTIEQVFELLMVMQAELMAKRGRSKKTA